MDANTKELIRLEKEKRKSEREKKKREQQNHTSLERAKKKEKNSLNEKLYLPVHSNITENLKVPNNVEEQTNSVTSAQKSFLHEKKIEPSTPTNKNSSNRDLKDEFQKYVDDAKKNSEIGEHARHIKKQKYHSNDKNVIQGTVNISEFNLKKRNSAIRTTESGELYLTGDKEKLVNYEDEQDKEVEWDIDEKTIENDGTIEEVYELIVSDDENVDSLEKGGLRNILKNKKTTFKRKDEIGDAENSVEGMEIDDSNELFDRNINNFEIASVLEKDEKDIIEEVLQNNNYKAIIEMESEKFFEWFDNYLDNLEKNAPTHSAYYEEVEYLLQMLKEKRKNMFGNLLDEENKKENTEEDILEELETFHKNLNADKNKKQEKIEEPVFNIDEIYEELGIKKKEDEVIGFSFIETEEEVKDDKQKEDMNEIEKKKDVQQLPKGFFDCTEKKEYLKSQSDLVKIDEQIKFLENEKRKMLQEYENAGHLYDEKINNYIDYLYDDEYEDKESLLQQLKEKKFTDNKPKGEQRRLIEAMLEEEKRKKEKQKKERELIESMNLKFDIPVEEF